MIERDWGGLETNIGDSLGLLPLLYRLLGFGGTIPDSQLEGLKYTICAFKSCTMNEWKPLGLISLCTVKAPNLSVDIFLVYHIISRVVAQALLLQSTFVCVELLLGDARLAQSHYLFFEELFAKLGSCERGAILQYGRLVSREFQGHMPDIGVLWGGSWKYICRRLMNHYPPQHACLPRPGDFSV